jgi:hypothetical protein
MNKETTLRIVIVITPCITDKPGEKGIYEGWRDPWEKFLLFRAGIRE